MNLPPSLTATRKVQPNCRLSAFHLCGLLASYLGPVGRRNVYKGYRNLDTPLFRVLWLESGPLRQCDSQLAEKLGFRGEPYGRIHRQHPSI